MSHAAEASTVPEDDLAPAVTAGYKVGSKKTVEEYAQLDAGDESLAKWKASLGIGAGGGGEKNVAMLSLSLVAESRTAGPLVFDLTDADKLASLKKNPVNIKEGSDYAVSGDVVSGLRYIQVVRRAGINVDKTDAMLGSYGPSAEPITKLFAAEEAPSGMLARSGTYNVRSRVMDDDKKIYVDFEWSFKLAKEASPHRLLPTCADRN
ncbi:hypothetical protein RQP46_008446 [Phenoliferia psychrophenolica]